MTNEILLRSKFRKGCFDDLSCGLDDFAPPRLSIPVAEDFEVVQIEMAKSKWSAVINPFH